MCESESDEIRCRPSPTACNAIDQPADEDPHFVPHQREVTIDGQRSPFVAQDGSTLYLVAGGASGWVVAELEFDAETCTFRLLRQAEYQWPREALGRLLSRMLASEAADGEIIRLSDAFSDWVADQFAA